MESRSIKSMQLENWQREMRLNCIEVKMKQQPSNDFMPMGVVSTVCWFDKLRIFEARLFGLLHGW